MLRLLLALLLTTAVYAERPRARDLGLAIGTLPTGPHNAITDVKGVHVGHVTLRSGDGPLIPGKGPVRTGVTAILPAPDPWAVRLPAAAFILNGNGEMTGLAYIQDVGLLESPILLTNTLNVGKVADAAVSWIIRRHPEVGVSDDVPIPVVAECDDSTLNDIQGRHVGEAEVFRALDQASDGPLEEGDVGGGTGMIAYDFKAGIGTASRRVGAYTLGALVMANMGERSELLLKSNNEPGTKRHNQGSIIMVLATDAPLSASQLQRLARRAVLGLARTGTTSHHGSGELVLAFSTANAIPRGSQARTLTLTALPDPLLDPLYQAAVEATEESIINSMLRAHTTVGRDGKTAPQLELRDRNR